MALNRRSTGLLLGLVGVYMLAGCGAGPAARDGARTAPKKGTSVSTHAKAGEPEVAPAQDWESFAKSGAALRTDIAARAESMKKGPIGNRGVQLASLRLAASGRDLIDAGSLDGALEALQRAVSLYGGNGYAYLYLAYVHHVQGHGEQAAEFAASARRYLPRDEAVRAELEGLTRSIRLGAVTAGT